MDYAAIITTIDKDLDREVKMLMRAVLKSSVHICDCWESAFVLNESHYHYHYHNHNYPSKLLMFGNRDCKKCVHRQLLACNGQRIMITIALHSPCGICSSLTFWCICMNVRLLSIPICWNHDIVMLASIDTVLRLEDDRSPWERLLGTHSHPIVWIYITS